MTKIVLVLIGIIALIGGGYYFLNSQSKTAPETPPISKPAEISPETSNKTPSQEEAAVMQEYTLEEIAKHDKNTDCWFAIEGNVYDVTKFIEGGKHPGKEAILQGCGKDATELFNTRPMGSGTPHSDKAREMLKNFEIGVFTQ